MKKEVVAMLLAGGQGGIPLPLAAAELIQGVEGEGGVDAAAGIEGIRRNFGGDSVHIGLDPQPVGPGHPGQVAVFVQKAVVHPPGVDAEGVQLPKAPLPEGQQALLQLAV